MSSRRTSGLIVALASAAVVASSGALAVSACSSSTDDAASTDAGLDVAPDVRRVVEEAGEDPDTGVLTPAQCAARCKADHPTAPAKEDAIDKCWGDNCSAPCVEQSGGFDGGTDARADADAGVCGTPNTSGLDETCDQCTEAFCCTSWTSCFNDPECAAYDKCVGACKPKPP